jgi:Domain of unknown function (DUF4252)
MKHAMKHFVWFAMLAVPGLALAQPLKLDSLDKLASKASDTVKVTLNGGLLRLAARFLSSDDPDEAHIKELVKGLKGIYVRSFEFSKAGQYADSDVEAIRSQLRDAAWSAIIEVRETSNKGGGDPENTEIYAKEQDNHFTGLAILVTEPKELTVVHIDGVIDIDGLAKLSGKFGIPDDIRDKVEKKSK